MEYLDLAKFIIENVGGKSNIESVENCTTRLRFILKDETKANTKKLEKKEGIKGVTQNTGQYQIIIGFHVPDVYKAVSSVLGDDITKATTTKKMSLLDRFSNFVVSIMSPILPLLIASGLIVGISFLFVVIGVLDSNGGVFTLLYTVGNGLLFFLPCFLGYTVANKLEMNPLVGFLIGACLCHPNINGVDINLFDFTVNATYTNTFLPVIFTVLLASYVDKIFKKILPEVIRSFVSIALVLVICVPIGFVVIGPIMNWLSNIITDGVLNVYALSPIICGILLGGLYQVMVLFGLHSIIGLVTMNNIFSGNPDPLAGLYGFGAFALTAATFALAIKTKNRKSKSDLIGSGISGLLGVTEPIIYGVMLPRVKIFVLSCIGGAIGGALAGIFNLQLHTYAGMGVIALLGMINPTDSSSLMYILLTVATVVVFAFVTTLLIYKDDSESNDSDEDSGEKILSPISGTVKLLSEVDDIAFSKGDLGDGIAIVPDDNKIIAPFNGKIIAQYPTKHAIGLLSDNGVELLIHIGLNTVQLKGNGFISYVEQGDFVEVGQTLLQFDMNKIASEHLKSDIIMIVTNQEQYSIISKTSNKKVKASDELMTVKKLLQN